MTDYDGKCDVCGEPILEWPERHNYHEEDCPSYLTGPETYDWGHCDCDLVAHPACCPTCNVEKEMK